MSIYNKFQQLQARKARSIHTPKHDVDKVGLHLAAFSLSYKMDRCLKHRTCLSHVPSVLLHLQVIRVLTVGPHGAWTPHVIPEPLAFFFFKISLASELKVIVSANLLN